MLRKLVYKPLENVVIITLGKNVKKNVYELLRNFYDPLEGYPLFKAGIKIRNINYNKLCEHGKVVINYVLMLLLLFKRSFKEVLKFILIIVSNTF